MRVIRVTNYMGGPPRHASFRALVRRIKFWLHQSTIAKNDKPALEPVGFYLLWGLHQESLKPVKQYRGQRLVLEAWEKRIKELEEEFAIYRDNSPSQNYVYNVKWFFAALEAIQSALFGAVHVSFSKSWSLRDKIKSLNLPKHLFPQSLRPVKVAAL